MSLKSDVDLRNLYSRLDANKETIVYCHSDVRSAETAAVLGKLGFSNVKVYDSSWLGYAAKLDAPVENEVFFNVGCARSSPPCRLRSTPWKKRLRRRASQHRSNTART